MLRAYAAAKISGRGVPHGTFQTRLYSCLSCESLCRQGPTMWCGACGCGLREEARITADPKTSKLSFVQLSCPKNREGFNQ